MRRRRSSLEPPPPRSVAELHALVSAHEATIARHLRRCREAFPHISTATPPPAARVPSPQLLSPPPTPPPPLRKEASAFTLDACVFVWREQALRQRDVKRRLIVRMQHQCEAKLYAVLRILSSHAACSALIGRVFRALRRHLRGTSARRLRQRRRAAKAKGLFVLRVANRTSRLRATLMGERDDHAKAITPRRLLRIWWTEHWLKHHAALFCERRNRREVQQIIVAWRGVARADEHCRWRVLARVHTRWRWCARLGAVTRRVHLLGLVDRWRAFTHFFLATRRRVDAHVAAVAKAKCFVAFRWLKLIRAYSRPVRVAVTFYALKENARIGAIGNIIRVRREAKMLAEGLARFVVETGQQRLRHGALRLALALGLRGTRVRFVAWRDEFCASGRAERRLQRLAAFAASRRFRRRAWRALTTDALPRALAQRTLARWQRIARNSAVRGNSAGLRRRTVHATRRLATLRTLLQRWHRTRGSALRTIRATQRRKRAVVVELRRYTKSRWIAKRYAARKLARHAFASWRAHRAPERGYAALSLMRVVLRAWSGAAQLEYLQRWERGAAKLERPGYRIQARTKRPELTSIWTGKMCCSAPAAARESSSTGMSSARVVTRLALQQKKSTADEAEARREAKPAARRVPLSPHAAAALALVTDTMAAALVGAKRSRRGYGRRLNREVAKAAPMSPPLVVKRNSAVRTYASLLMRHPPRNVQRRRQRKAQRKAQVRLTSHRPIHVRHHPPSPEKENEQLRALDKEDVIVEKEIDVIVDRRKPNYKAYLTLAKPFSPPSGRRLY